MDEVVKKFIGCPCVGSLESCTKKQLALIGEHYGIDVDQWKNLDCVKEHLKAGLVEQGVLKSDSPGSSASHLNRRCSLSLRD